MHALLLSLTLGPACTKPESFSQVAGTAVTSVTEVTKPCFCYFCTSAWLPLACSCCRVHPQRTASSLPQQTASQQEQQSRQRTTTMARSCTSAWPPLSTRTDGDEARLSSSWEGKRATNTAVRTKATPRALSMAGWLRPMVSMRDFDAVGGMSKVNIMTCDRRTEDWPRRLRRAGFGWPYRHCLFQITNWLVFIFSGGNWL